MIKSNDIIPQGLDFKYCFFDRSSKPVFGIQYIKVLYRSIQNIARIVSKGARFNVYLKYMQQEPNHRSAFISINLYHYPI